MNKTRYFYAAVSDMGIGYTYDSPCWMVLAFQTAKSRNEYVAKNPEKAKVVTRNEACKIAPELRTKSPHDAWRVSVVDTTADNSADRNTGV